MIKSELRKAIVTAKQEWRTKHPVIPIELTSNSPPQQSVRIAPGFKNNAEPKGVYKRLELYAVTLKTCRVMGYKRKKYY